MVRNTKRGALAAVLAGLILGTFGTVAAQDRTAETGGLAQRTIQDPDNPASRLYFDSATSGQTVRVVRDPENPYWSGFTGSVDIDMPGSGLLHGPY